MTCLQALRIYGPLTLEQIARRCAVPQVEADWHAWKLERDGLVEITQPHPLRPTTGSLWDVTEAGRLLFAAQMDCQRRDAACVGGRP